MLWTLTWPVNSCYDAVTQFTCQRRLQPPDLDPDLQPRRRPDPVPACCWSGCGCRAAGWRWSWPGGRRCRRAAAWTSSDTRGMTSTADPTPRQRGSCGGRRHRRCGWSRAGCAGQWRRRGRWDTRSARGPPAAAAPTDLPLRSPTSLPIQLLYIGWQRRNLVPHLWQQVFGGIVWEMFATVISIK